MIKKLLKLFALYVIIGNIIKLAIRVKKCRYDYIQCRHDTPYVGTVEYKHGIVMNVFTEQYVNVLPKHWHRKGDIVMYVRGKLYNYEV